MAPTDFTSRLAEIQARKSSVLCVGLDPDPTRLPPHLLEKYALADAVLAFNTAVIEATAEPASAFKLNLAFYEALGRDGWRVLNDTLNAIPGGVVSIADGKRGDIGNSARFYAESAFLHLGFDACTVSPYLGRDSIEPFLRFEGRGVFVLVRTSNPGSADFQELPSDGDRLFQRVVRAAATWDDGLPGTVGFVVGATDAAAIESVRHIAPDDPLLIPGIGAQGGDAEAVIRATEVGTGPVVINSSRSVIYASEGRDFAKAAAREAEALRRTLEKLRH